MGNRSSADRTEPLFGPALRALSDSGEAYLGPIGFQRYCKEHGRTGVSTAAAISVDLYEDLAPELRAASTMVLRLGAVPGRAGTSFALVKAENLATEFFISDVPMRGAPVVRLAAAANAGRFAPLRIFPNASEYSLLGVGLSAGAFSVALGLDDEEHAHLPISGHFTATFSVGVGHGIALQHGAGQVEVDATFVGHRDGKPTLFVIETKRGPPRGALAKHKLAYPILAMAPRLDPHIAIVPVYCRTWLDDDTAHFVVMECSYGDPRERPVPITELAASRCTHVTVPL